MRSRLRLDDYKTGFARNKAKVYESLVSLLFKQRDGGRLGARGVEIFAVIEKAKARAFLETLFEDSNHRSESEAPGLRSQEDVLSAEIANIISRMSRNDLPRRQKLELESKLGIEEEKYLRLLSRNQAEPKGPGALASPLSVEAADVQLRLLDGKTAVLEYYLRKGLSLLVLVTKNDLKIIELPPRDPRSTAH